MTFGKTALRCWLPAAALLLALLCPLPVAAARVSTAIPVSVRTDGAAADAVYTVELTPLDAAPAPVQRALTVKNGGTVYFTGFAFDEPGDYRYLVAERSGGAAHTTYDAHSYTVTVRVTGRPDGGLAAGLWAVRSGETAKADGVLCGLDVFERTFAILDPASRVQRFAQEGSTVCSGQVLATVTGDVRALLSGERVALNYLQRMSGIATYTRRVARLLEGSGTTLVDTRKTTPNMRVFEKEAVRTGGGRNHRYNLSDGVMLKDNHIAAAGGVRQAVAAARAYAPFVRKIEVECETLDQVREAVKAGADIIMLDNMDHDTMARAIELIGDRALTECSGNITRDNVQTYIDLGVDFISSGALTHSAGILDLSMKNLRIEA